MCHQKLELERSENGEVFLGAFLSVIMKTFFSPDMVKFLREEGFEKKVNKWGKTLEIIVALLQDAEEKQLTDKAVRLWLDDLEELAYDAEDILDEFEYEAIARKVKMDQLQSSIFLKHVPTGLSNCTPDVIKFRYRMWRHINRISSRFNELCDVRGKLGLRDITGGGSSSSKTEPLKPATTTSLQTGAVYGRDEDKDTILKMVKRNEPIPDQLNPNVQVIPIVGMGGVGKTTLAREVYNHPDVVGSFEVKAWVCVSDGPFDVIKVSKSILMDITGSSSEQKGFNTVQNELNQLMSRKQFLLVLDDVWNICDRDWEILRSPFQESAPGSKIIVTTRDKNVASTFTLNGSYNLKILSDNDCWSVFSMRLPEIRDAIAEHPRFKEIQECVVKNCKGLPLAAKALGGLLRGEQLDDWLKMLDSRSWTTLDNQDNEIPTALLLSYHHLSFHLQRCFSYSAIFPKDHEFEIEKIVPMWIAQGFVAPSTENEPLVETGCKYFRELEGRSMFQQSNRKDRITYVMHDLFHDLAESVFGNKCLRLEGESATNEQLRGLKKVRHFSYTQTDYDGEGRFEIVQRDGCLQERIRTFFPLPCWWSQNYIGNSIPLLLLPKLRRLRLLSLQNYQNVRSPILVGSLKHIRYLNFHGTIIESLPESISTLYNLKFLILSFCAYLKKLPSNFKYLLKLCYFDMEGSVLISETPFGMKDLRCLQYLSHFILGKNGKGSSIDDLKNLKKLRGKLCIKRLENVSSCIDNQQLLRDKEHLEELLLEWKSSLEELPKVLDENVLVMLQPHENLKKLTIEGYGGANFPSWVGAASYSKMKVLKLKNCAKCESLPSLGDLGFLEELIIEGLKSLKFIRGEFYGKINLNPFISLKSLSFKNLPIFSIWEIVGDPFSHLQSLSIVDCPQLSGSLPQHVVALKDLFIWRCKQLVVSFSCFPPELSKIVIDGCKTIKCDNPEELKSIKYLELSNIAEYSYELMHKCFGKSEAKKAEEDKRVISRSDEICPQLSGVRELHSLKFLGQLFISKILNMVSIPEVCSLPLLRILRIEDCNALISLPKEMTTENECLESVEIWFCSSLQFIVSGHLPPSLKRMEIGMCGELKRLWDDRGGESSNTNSSQLEVLDVKFCQSLTSLSSIIQFPSSLKQLCFSGCEELTKLNRSGELPASLITLWLEDCPKLRTITWDRFLQIPNNLHNLSNLRKLTLDNCGSMENFSMEGPATNTHLTKLCILNCQELKALPNGLSGIDSLEEVWIEGCPNISSFNSDEVFPVHIKSLRIHRNSENVYRSLVGWGLQNLNSLTSLTLGDIDVETFPHAKLEVKLPSSLTQLEICSSSKLKKLQGLGQVISLQFLRLWKCSNLTSFGDEGLPSSLQILCIENCPKLEMECRRNEGREWSKISNIPKVFINDKLIFVIEDQKDRSNSHYYRWSHLTNPWLQNGLELEL